MVLAGSQQVTMERDRNGAGSRRALLMRLLPIMTVIVTVYIVIGLAMPVIPLHVHDKLGFGTFAVGVVSGSQFMAAMILRPWAGRYVDTRGAREALKAGLIGASVSGVVYWLSCRFIDQHLASISILVLGRIVLGGAECFVITGALSVGIALLGSDNTGKVMAWIGTALYVAFALGAPAGSFLYSRYGFSGIVLAAALSPTVGLITMRFVPRIAPTTARVPAPLSRVLNAVWMPGIGVALSGVGFGAVTTFIVLLYEAHRWNALWIPFTVLSLSFIFGRLTFGDLPDVIGGARVALFSIAVESVGQLLIWQCRDQAEALVGVTLTGVGFSLVYPALGVEAIRRAPQASRGLAMGAYTAFLDLSVGVMGPALGWIAGVLSLRAAFLASTCSVLFAALISALIMRTANILASDEGQSCNHGIDVIHLVSSGKRVFEEC